MTRTGGAIECGECSRPILVTHIYYVAGADVDGNHPFCWHCAVSIKLSLGELDPEDLPALRQFGPL